jgi:hypothetical protein
MVRNDDYQNHSQFKSISSTFNRIIMRFYTNLHAVFIVTLLFFTAFSLSFTDPRIRETIRSDVRCPIL